LLHLSAVPAAILRISVEKLKKSKLIRNFTKLYRNLYKNTYRGCAKFCNIPNKSQFFLFFWPKRAKSQLKKKSRLIQNVTKLCTSSICIFIEVSIKFHCIPTKSRFILIFRPNHKKRNFFPCASSKKCPRGWNFSLFFALMFRTKKNNISHTKFEFFNEGRIKYEFLTCLNLRHQNIKTST